MGISLPPVEQSILGKAATYPSKGCAKTELEVDGRGLDRQVRLCYPGVSI